MIEEMLSLSDGLASGLKDPDILVKMQKQEIKLNEALNSGDIFEVIMEACDCAYYAVKAEWNQVISTKERDEKIRWYAAKASIPTMLLFRCIKAKYNLRAQSQKDIEAERKIVIEQIYSWDHWVPFNLGILLLKQIDTRQLHYPIRLSLNQLAYTLYKEAKIFPQKQLALEGVLGYITGFFDLLRIIGISRYEDSDQIILDEMQVALVRAVCFAVNDGIPSLFYFGNLASTQNPNFGEWLLNRVEQAREKANPIREYSRYCDYSVVLVKAKLNGREAILFQKDNEGSGKYEMIAARVYATDSSRWHEAARRAITTEVQDTQNSASKIKLSQLSKEVFQYSSVSKRLGAYTLYRVMFFECNLQLPHGCMNETFTGKKGRETRWIPVEHIAVETEEIAYGQLFDYLREKGWFYQAQLSTLQMIESVATNKRTKLHSLLSAHFSGDELRTLCFDLQVDYDDLPGNDKKRELILYFERQGLISDLVDACKRYRPHILWDSL